MREPSLSRMVAIVGGSGSGKTWLAERLQGVFGTAAARCSLDSFYRDCSHLSRDRRQRINFDHPQAIDWPLFKMFLAHCRGGKTTSLPQYDFASHSRLQPDEPFAPRPLILVEGLWLLHYVAIREFFALSIFIDCPARLRLTRRLARDCAERGRSSASVRAQFAQTVAPMHQRFVSPQKGLADILLKQPVGDTTVQELARRIRLLLPGPGVQSVESAKEFLSFGQKTEQGLVSA